MRVGERARVVRIERPTDEDRSEWQDKEGLLMRRLNVAWTPVHGALWELRFDGGEVVVFSENEVVVVGPDGADTPSGIEDLREEWGKAPRRPSVPYRKAFAGSGVGPAVLALLVFALAGTLLVVAGVATSSWLLIGGGAVLVLLGIAAAGVGIT